MKADRPNDPLHDLRWEDNDPMSDPVWRLLARAPRLEPDAWFAVRTLARCRREKLNAATGVSSFARLAGVWRWALGGGLGICLAVVLVVAQIHSERINKHKQKSVQEAFEIMASIDPDSDSSSSSSWQDSSP